MIGYTTFGSNDIPKAVAFYDQLFDLIGISRFYDYPTFVSWGQSPNQPMFCLLKPHNGEAATAGNGTMIAIQVDNTDLVDKLHQRALALGSKNEGDPGLRPGGFYCGYFRDLDGNKLNVYHYCGEQV